MISSNHGDFLKILLYLLIYSVQFLKVIFGLGKVSFRSETYLLQCTLNILEILSFRALFKV